jgi:hypothetical protein
MLRGVISIGASGFSGCTTGLHSTELKRVGGLMLVPNGTVSFMIPSTKSMKLMAFELVSVAVDGVDPEIQLHVWIGMVGFGTMRRTR